MSAVSRSILFVTFIAGAVPCASYGQTEVRSPLDRQIDTVAGEIAKAKVANPTATIPDGEIDLFAFRGLQQGSLARLLADHEEQRSDEQLGATSTASGTTTLVSKGTVPQILAFAVENGAISRSQSGTTLTFRGNLGGAIAAMAGKGFIKTVSSGVDPAQDLLKRLSLSASFDTSRGATADTSAFTGDQQQLSQWSVRVQILNRRDPLRPEYRQRWQALTSGSLAGLTQAAATVDASLRSDPAFVQWRSEAAAAIAATGADVSAIRQALAAQMDRFPLATLRQPTVQALTAYDRAAAAFTRDRQTVLDDIARGAQVAFEFTNDRPVRLPKTLNYRLVGAVGGSVDLTGNASLTVFEDIPTGASRRLRDYQLSAELAMRLGSVETTGPFVLTVSGKYLHQFENSLDESGIMKPDTAGTTAIGQVKLTVPVKGSGVRLPLSVTFANRTELIKEKEIRGNVGITYDLDTLFARFKP